jgi:hypothetical protein
MNADARRCSNPHPEVVSDIRLDLARRHKVLVTTLPER